MSGRGCVLVLEEPGEGLAGGGGDALEGVQRRPVLAALKQVDRMPAHANGLRQPLLREAGLFSGSL
jgi:hypothetical protein